VLPGCTGLLGYAESLADGPGLRRLADIGKPVALLKAGSSAAGAKAATSHTGALAASDRVVDDLLRQMHIARAGDVEELLDLGDAFEQPRRPGSNRVAVVTTSGGSGILAADAVDATSLRLAELSTRTTAALAEVVPAFGSTANPVDVTATVMSDPTLFDRCLAAVADDPEVDAVLACFCVLTGDDVDRIVAALGRVADRSGKPVFAARTGADFLAPGAATALRSAGIATYPTPARAVRALAALWDTRAQDRGSGPDGTGGSAAASLGRAAAIEAHREPVVLSAPAPGATEVELKALLAAAGLPVPPGRLARDGDDARRAVDDLGARAVLKAVVPGLLHKTEAGAVAVDVSADDAAATYKRLAALGGDVFVEEMVAGGAEVLVGVAPTPLGQVVTLASGGVLAEVIDDAVFRLLPIGDADARSMVSQLRGAAVLHGARGREPLDVAALVDLLVRLSDLTSAWPAGYELDLNPVAVQPDGVSILDAGYVAPPGTPA
jgi:acyl-CoA synthetase (NDP forming)